VGNGHSGRAGRGGNRRTRRGPPRPRGPEALTGSVHAAQASSTPPPAPAEEPGSVPAPETHTASSPDAPRSEPPAARPRFDRRGPQLVTPGPASPLPARQPPSNGALRPSPSPGPQDTTSEPSRRNGHAPTSRVYDPHTREGHFVVASAPVQNGHGAHGGHGGHGDAGDVDDEAPYEFPRREVRGEVGALIDALHAVFERDRAVASQGGAKRCGICYLHFSVTELEYREDEGHYVCAGCAAVLHQARLPMVRRQQR
jgi:hypothetical protein